MQRMFAKKLLSSLFVTTVLSACGTHQLFEGTVECDGTRLDTIMYYDRAKEEGFFGLGNNNAFNADEMDDIENKNGEFNFVVGAIEVESQEENGGLDGDATINGQKCKFTADPPKGSYQLYDADINCGGASENGLLFLDASAKEGHFAIENAQNGGFSFITMDNVDTDNGKLEFDTTLSNNGQQLTLKMETESGDNGSFDGSLTINGTECDIELTPDQ